MESGHLLAYLINSEHMRLKVLDKKLFFRFLVEFICLDTFCKVSKPKDRIVFIIYTLSPKQLQINSRQKGKS